MKRLVLLGPPASGKGTQAKLLARWLEIPTTSTGAILRQEKAQGTSRGQEADAYTRDGNFVPDAMIFELVEEWLADHHGGFIFDGFPRTVSQGEWLERWLLARGMNLDAVFLLEANPETIHDRVMNRLVCAQCGLTTQIGNGVAGPSSPCPKCGSALERRRDDTEESLRHRMQAYETLTAPLIPFYEHRRLLIRIDANGSAEETFHAAFIAWCQR